MDAPIFLICICKISQADDTELRANPFEVLPQPFFIRVSNKYLALIYHADLMKQIADAAFIQFLENIIEQQERGEVLLLRQHFHFSQLQREEQALTLSL